MAKEIPPWYHGRISGDDATRILTRFRQPGAFLLRDSQNMEGAYTLTVSCSVDESGRFVDVKNYRITKNRLKGRKKFPSVKDLQKCMEEQEERRDGRTTSLVLPVERSEIEKWDSIDGNWREKFRVREGENDEQQKGTQKKQKDQDKRSNKSPIKWRTKKGKAKEEIDIGQYEKLKHKDHGSSCNDHFPSEQPGSQVCASKDEEYCYPDANDWNDNDLARKATKESISSHDSNNDKDSQLKDSKDNAPTSKETITPIREPGSQNYNDETGFNSGIYFTTAGQVVPRNEIPKNCEVDDNKVDKPNVSNTGIYMSSNQAIGKDREKEMPKSHEACKSGSSNESNVPNSGIYMSSSQATGKKKDGKNEPNEESTSIPMSPKQDEVKDEGDEVSVAREYGEITSGTKPNVSSSGIYMSAKQATGKGEVDERR